MSGENELKPCPFCGRPGVRLESGSWDRGYSYRVGCKVKFDDKCLLAHGGKYGYSTQKEADDEWNKRATPPGTEVVPEGVMEAIESALKCLIKIHEELPADPEDYVEPPSMKTIYKLLTQAINHLTRHRATQKDGESTPTTEAKA